MTWTLMYAGLFWILIWIIVFAKMAASRDNDGQVKIFNVILPIFFALTLLLLFRAVPERGPVFKLVLWIHHLAIFCLFLFLCAAQLFQTQAWWQIREKQPSEDIAMTMRHLWVLTQIAPAPIALVIFLTGLRMIWESPVDNPSAFWLMMLILTFSVFFFDGILGYQPIVQRMHRYWEKAAGMGTPTATAAKEWHSTIDHVQLFLHFLSWPFVFMLGVYRWNPENSFSPQVVRLEQRFAMLPDTWPNVVAALILWTSMGLLVAVVRLCGRLVRAERSGKPAREHFPAAH